MLAADLVAQLPPGEMQEDIVERRALDGESLHAHLVLARQVHHCSNSLRSVLRGDVRDAVVFRHAHNLGN